MRSPECGLAHQGCGSHPLLTEEQLGQWAAGSVCSPSWFWKREVREAQEMFPNGKAVGPEHLPASCGDRDGMGAGGCYRSLRPPSLGL